MAVQKQSIELEVLLDRFKSGLNKALDMAKNAGQEAKRNFSTGFNIDTKQAEKRLDELYDKIKSTVEKSKATMQKIKDQKLFMSSKDIYAQDYGQQLKLKSYEQSYSKQIQDIKAYSSEYKELNSDLNRTNTLSGATGVITRSLKDTFEDAGQSIKRAFGGKNKQDIKEVTQDVKEMQKTSSGGGLSNMFSKATKSLKRFALSLFGIRSIFSMISRATRAYLGENEKLSNKLNSVWAGLGSLLSPIIDYLSTLFLKLLGYINEFTKALWGFDFIAKANANTLKNYNKQLQKTQKSLAGIDELNNLNQDTGSTSSPNLIEIPPLNQDIVNGLKDMAHWLEENWDWIVKVGEALAITFGVVKVAEVLGGISSLMGGAGSGLIGLATIGTIVIGVNLLYTGITGRDLISDITQIINDLQDLKKYNDDLKKSTEENGETSRGFIETITEGMMNAKKGSKEANTEFAKGLAQLKSAQGRIEYSAEEMKKYGTSIGRYVVGSISGTVDELKTMNEEAENTRYAYLHMFDTMIQKGELTKEQILDINEAIGQERYSVEGLNKVYINTSDGAKLLYDNTKNYQETLAILSDKTTADFLKQQTQIDKTGQVTTDYFNKLKDFVKQKYNIDISTKLGLPETSAFTQKINDMINKIIENNGYLKILGFKFKVPGFAVGTDRVKSDGFAYIHAGEQIVPADAVGGGYTGKNNEETNNLLRQLITTLEDKQFTASIGADEVGKASVNYIRNQNRIMGGSVV